MISVWVRSQRAYVVAFWGRTSLLTLAECPAGCGGVLHAYARMCFLMGVALQNRDSGGFVRGMCELGSS
jgi:hypothetical protein